MTLNNHTPLTLRNSIKEKSGCSTPLLPIRIVSFDFSLMLSIDFYLIASVSVPLDNFPAFFMKQYFNAVRGGPSITDELHSWSPILS